ncbi:hypothetical protein [uncultured Methylobacterium sp.]|uniref:DUF4376 domain-containing protein n=1 Tax=uncultured Methylobacterium sp. TaxID=157278 RepID=UPI0035C954C1
MLLAIKLGAEINGVVADLVCGDYRDDAVLSLEDHPGAYLVPWTGSLVQLERIGPATASQYDHRPYRAPPIDKTMLAAFARRGWAAVLAHGVVVNVAEAGAAPVPVLCDGTNQTRADLGLLALFGQAYPAGTKTWIDNEGVVTMLTGAQLVRLSTLVGEWISSTYPRLGAIEARIAAGTLADLPAVDAAVATLAEP